MFSANICNCWRAAAYGQSEQSSVAAENTVGLAASWSSDDTWLVLLITYYWQGIGLAIYRSRVRVLAGHLCVVALGKLLTPVCLCHQAVLLVLVKWMISLTGKVTAGLTESNGSLPPGLWLSDLQPDCQETRLSSVLNTCTRLWDYFTIFLTVLQMWQQDCLF